VSEKVPDEIVNELKKAARSRDPKAMGKAIDRHWRDLPEDLLEAREDQKILKETMNLFNQDLADVHTEGVRLKVENVNCNHGDKRKKH
jgi:hypothetical protein